MSVVKILLIVLGVNALVWTLVLAGMKRKASLLAESINATCATTGECLVIGPESGYYNYMKGIASVKTMGVIALTNRRLIFKGAIGMNADIPLDQIADLSHNTWFQGNYRNGQEFLILKLKDGREVAFQVSDIRKWTDAIQSAVNG
jgi:hypothetical protein